MGKGGVGIKGHEIYEIAEIKITIFCCKLHLQKYERRNHTHYKCE